MGPRKKTKTISSSTTPDGYLSYRKTKTVTKPNKTKKVLVSGNSNAERSQDSSLNSTFSKTKQVVKPNRSKVVERTTTFGPNAERGFLKKKVVTKGSGTNQSVKTKRVTPGANGKMIRTKTKS